MNWDQLWTILWLRWRLTRNQFSRRGGINAVIAMIFVIIGFCMGAVGGLAGLLAGTFAMTNITPMMMLGIWDAITAAFLFFWIMGIVGEIQRSETIDIGRLMHLPVSLKNIFLINYLASHLNQTLILFLPGMIGLSLGLTLGRSFWMIFLLPLVLGFVFMITAWTYCLRGWLVRLMVNERRRRAIIAAVTLAIILLSQLPYLVTNVLQHRRWDRPYIKTTEEPDSGRQNNYFDNNKGAIISQTILLAHEIVPFLWVSNGAMSLADGNILPAILGAAGTILIGGLGIRRAYRATVRFYEGQATAPKTTTRLKKEKIRSAKKSFSDWRIPGVGDEASALAAAFFRCLIRAPEVKMALAMNIIMPLIFGGVIFFRRPSDAGDIAKTFIATGAIAFTLLGSSRFLFNQFGYDRSGFRTLVLSPVSRRHILLGKNIALMPIAVGIGLFFLVIVKFALNVSLMIIFAAFLQLLTAFFLLSIAGNIFSVLIPYRIAVGSLKPTKLAPLTTFLLFLSHLVFPMLMFPIFLAPGLGLLFSALGWLPGATGNLLFSILILAVAAFCYRLSLRSLGDLLQRREKEILRVVTQEVE